MKELKKANTEYDKYKRKVKMIKDLEQELKDIENIGCQNCKRRNPCDDNFGSLHMS